MGHKKEAARPVYGLCCSGAAVGLVGLSGCQRCCQATVCCRAVGQLSGTVRCLCQTSCQVLSVLSGAVGCVSDSRARCSVAVGCCRSCRVLLSDAVGAVGAVRLLLLLSDVGLLLSGAVRCCQVVLSGCCQALTHTSHTYDTIKRKETSRTLLAATQLPPSYGVITPAAAAAWGAQMAAQAQAAAAAQTAVATPTQTPYTYGCRAPEARRLAGSFICSSTAAGDREGSAEVGREG
mmetsp:Transcript_5958/g.17884  ORF Transcript_5958/g.17884 Transcript_5958/m.17884 type:complete len:235 (-) Transcript_5958:152-856(-)